MLSPGKRPVLIVEDEVLVSMVVEELVAEAGFDPVVAHDADAAIALLEAEVEGFTAVLTDIRTPGKTTGWDVGRVARERFPLVPIIYMTGDSADRWRAYGVPGSKLLQKPFNEFNLVSTLATALNEVDTRMAR